MPPLTATSMAARDSSSGADPQACSCQMSMWSVCNRRRDACRSASRACREVSTTRFPSRMPNPALVAMTSSSRWRSVWIRRPIIRSASPAAYAAAVSTRLPPASTNARSRGRASSIPVSRPQVRVPRPSRETWSPLWPTARRCIVAAYASRTPVSSSTATSGGEPQPVPDEDPEVVRADVAQQPVDDRQGHPEGDDGGQQDRPPRQVRVVGDVLQLVQPRPEHRGNRQQERIPRRRLALVAEEEAAGDGRPGS